MRYTSEKHLLFAILNIGSFVQQTSRPCMRRVFPGLTVSNPSFSPPLDTQAEIQRWSRKPFACNLQDLLNLYCSNNAPAGYTIARYADESIGESKGWRCFQNGTLNSTRPGVCVLNDGTCSTCYPGPTRLSLSTDMDTAIQGKRVKDRCLRVPQCFPILISKIDVCKWLSKTIVCGSLLAEERL